MQAAGLLVKLCEEGLLTKEDVVAGYVRVYVVCMVERHEAESASFWPALHHVF